MERADRRAIASGLELSDMGVKEGKLAAVVSSDERCVPWTDENAAEGSSGVRGE